MLVMGDLNDAPWARSVMELLNATYSRSQIEEPIRLSEGSLPSYKAYVARSSPLFNPMWSLMTEPDTGTFYDTRCSRVNRRTIKWDKLNPIEQSA